MVNLTLFQGRRDQHRSKKREFKPVEVKKDNMDQQTKDEKEYLDPELFQILQDVKTKITSGEIAPSDRSSHT